MYPYIPNGPEEKAAMLAVIGKASDEAFFTDIPAELRLKDGIPLPKSLSEMDVLRELTNMASKNTTVDQKPCFLGAGAYDSYIPTAVKHLVGRSEFYTAYTPYQPEISQGTLQAIFEYQTMICELTGLDVSNASMYDGASACAEAAMLAVSAVNKKRVLVSAGVHPETRQVISTYARFRGIDVVEVPLENGVTNLSLLAQLLEEPSAAVIIQNPNFLGHIEPAEQAVGLAHDKKAMYVAYVADALSLALLKTPGEIGADVAAGEGQCFGNGLGFGGPYLGFIATTQKNMRKMPGRICGQSVDVDGKRSFVLTLQAREQHIRREKATSNICSNQALNALTATVYLSFLGKEGLREAAVQSHSKAQYLKEKLTGMGLEPISDKPTFREFAVKLPKDGALVNRKLLDAGYIGGFVLANAYPDLGNSMLFCTTEKRTRQEIDGFCAALQSILEG